MPRPNANVNRKASQIGKVKISKPALGPSTMVRMMNTKSEMPTSKRAETTAEAGRIILGKKTFVMRAECWISD
jgi:hypothetical protein